MSLRDPHSGDRLDALLRGALDNLVAGQEPPDHIWSQIKAELTQDVPSPMRPRFVWLAPVLPVVLVALFFALRGTGLRLTGSPLRETTSAPTREWSPSAAGVSMEPRSAPAAVLAPMDEVELRFLKTRSPLRSRRRVGASHKSRPLAIAAMDIPPHPASPEGRLLKAARSGVSVPLEERHLLTGGPHQW